jgi:hypothetical protein
VELASVALISLFAFGNQTNGTIPVYALQWAHPGSPLDHNFITLDRHSALQGDQATTKLHVPLMLLSIVHPTHLLVANSIVGIREIQMPICTLSRQNHHSDDATRASIPLDRLL